MYGKSRLVAKVSDFGLSKTFYDNMIYKKRQRQYVPWKWMAPEFLYKSCFTLASDVWSFGIVLWEIFSMGHEPYAEMTAEDLIKKLQNGYSLPMPDQIDKVN